MIIRKATINDSLKILPLWISLMEFHSTENIIFETSSDYKKELIKDIEKLINSPAVTFFIVEELDQMIAFSMTTITNRPVVFAKQRKGYIGDTFVSESYRGKGVGTKLISEIKSWFKSQNIDFIDLQVTKTNEKGKSFWESNGFKIVNYYMVNNLNDKPARFE
jgi:ribosomal protein S18 acetylase RimI-like enzyme